MSEARPKEISVTASEQPGQLLCQAREKLDLSARDIASNLHLEQRIILALEADDYSNLPAATYVRGYLRAYAKAVNLDSDYIISLYDPDAPEPPEILPEIKHRTQISSSDKPVKAVTYLITLGLVLLLLIWWQSHFIIDKTALTENSSAITSVDQTEISTLGLDYEYKIVIHPDNWQSGYGDAGEAVSQQPQSGDTDSQNMESQLEDLAMIDVLELQPPVEQEQALQASQDETGSETVATGPDNIMMKLTADCWIEVFDASDTKIYMTLARAGYDVLINGTAPFNVLLGFAPGVNVTFNGEVFDTTPFTIGGVARFTLGE
jgi:cytoskeleton protein RodZ